MYNSNVFLTTDEPTIIEHMPELTWIGKDKVVNHHHDVPFRILEKQYSFESRQSGKSSQSGKFGNKIIHGDNLAALKSLLPEYEGRIKCIYVDPPYTRATKAGFTTITSTIQSSKNGSSR